MTARVDILADGRDDLSALLDFVSRHAGLVFPPNRRAIAAGGVQRALQRLGAKDARELLARVTDDLESFDELMAELTVGETYFFRESAQFEFIQAEVVPRFRSGFEGKRVLRGWSAACASGEEAYSLAITLREAAPENPFHVVGTDVSRVRLRAAQRGVYKDWSLRGVGAERTRRHFTPQGKLHRLTDRDRQSVEFRYLNLAEDVFPSIASGIWGMDVVMCRNVLIYFDLETIRRVAARLLDSLSDDGWLFLGASDPIVSDLVPCEVELTGAGVAYRKARARAQSASTGVWVTRGFDASPMEPPQSSTRIVEVPERVPFDGQGAPPRDRNASPNPEASRVAGSLTPASAGSIDALRRAYSERDYATVVEGVRALLGSGSPTVEAWTLMVRSLANEGRLTEAGTACAAAIEAHGTSAELMYLHGVLLGQADRPAECAAAARRALYLDRGLVVASLLLGSALTRLGDTAAAERVLAGAERALSTLDPQQVVPASDGEPAGRLREMARVQLRLLATRGAR